MTKFGIDALLPNLIDDYAVRGWLNQLQRESNDFQWQILVPKSQADKFKSTDQVKFISISDKNGRINKKELNIFATDKTFDGWLTLNQNPQFNQIKSVQLLTQMPVYRPCAKQIVVTSAALREKIAKEFRLPTAAISVVYPGADALNESSDQVTFICTSSSAKDLILLIEAIATCALKHRTRRFNFVAPKDEVGTIKSVLRGRRINNVSIYSFDTLVAVLKQTQIIVIFNRDGAPVPLWPTLQPKPIICIKSDLNLEIFDDGAYYLSNIDIVSIVDVVTNMLKQAGMRDILVKRISEQIKRFDWQRGIDQIIKVMQNER